MGVMPSGNDTDLDCHNTESVELNASPVSSALMFAAGVLGNAAALLLIEVRRRKERSRNQREYHRRTLFHVLVTALVVTDLASTCLVSPLVQAAHALNTTLIAMTENRGACHYFGFAMTFLSLVTLSLLLAMALERYVSIGYPYLYGRRVSTRCGYVAIPCVYALCALFCCLPFAGFGRYVQYCPGTWCFIDMNPKHSADRVFANVYATVMLLMVLATAACNCFVSYHLVMMYRRRMVNRGSSITRSRKERRPFSLSQEVEFLILLVIMTVIFVICSLPLMIRVYINSIQRRNENKIDLIALRFISSNAIIDPWVFIILSPSRLRFLLGALCKAGNRNSMYRTSLAKNSDAQLDASQCPNLTVTTEITHINKSVQMI
ncbi:prostaglandin E receptor 2a (subtype EP2) [Clarias gariepinus]|uniref:prostaglandin E receptor 2a (subtype EP2) n=1 Tax=Clarias gariepinus TaxID=13013 RepID=UPI00234CE602|nr:prostaglandin E receptor 2a (subtype EP2) [Clarias gariepinus]